MEWIGATDRRGEDEIIANSAGKRATIKTIADLTGLSPSTVSLALRDGSRLKVATQELVLRTAEQIGYVPNRAGVRLRTGKTNVITLVLERTDETIDFVRYLIQGIGHGIKGTRYHLNVTPEFDASSSVASIRTIIDNRMADGVIITHTTARDPRVQMLMEAEFPFVTHGRTEFYTPHASHDYDSDAFVQLAVDRLVAKGCRRMLLVAGREQTYNYHNIMTSYRRVAAERGIAAETLSPVSDHPASDVKRQVGQQIAQMQVRPDGIICDTEALSILMLAGLQSAGVPLGTFQFVCKQTSDLLPALYPDVDMIEEDVLAAGMELARLLVRRIGGEPAEALRTLGSPVVHWHV